MKRFIAAITLLVLLSSLAARGGDYSKYYEGLGAAFSEPAAPVIPDNSVSLVDFGGVGDGVASNTEAFRKAISKLEKLGGGHLVVPAGIWLTGPISLKSCIDLHLEAGSIILFSPDKAEFVDDKGKVKPGISASKRTDVSISGEGIIDGNGEWWRAVKRGKVSDVEWADYLRMGGTEDGSLWYPFNLKDYGNIAPDMKAQEKMRTHLVRFTDCERVLVQGVTIQNAPKFHLVPSRCKDVTIVDVKVRCPWNAQNGDGIDIMNSKNVLIAGCTVDVGDDAICLKAGGGDVGYSYGPCKNVVIVDNTVYHGHGGFVIGSEFSGGIEDVYVCNNTFSGTDTGLRFKSGPGRGGKISNLVIDSIRMNDIRGEAVVFETTYVNVPVGESGQAEQTSDWLPDFSGIRISNVICAGARIGIAARGDASMIHHNLVKDSVFICSEKNTELEDPSMVTLENVRF